VLLDKDRLAFIPRFIVIALALSVLFSILVQWYITKSMLMLSKSTYMGYVLSLSSDYKATYPCLRVVSYCMYLLAINTLL